MARVKMVPGEWGGLLSDTPLTSAQIAIKAQDLLGRMSLEEKIAQMSGDTPLVSLSALLDLILVYNRRPVTAGENVRLGIPGIRFSDGPRGVVMYHSTCFPVSMGRGATWDVELEGRVGDAIGVEARSQGANLFAGVCINLLRHPAWGRAQETYGEDPYLLGEMGAALVKGVQRHVMACVKHYALNSMENARFKVDVQVDERALREIYLPHFKRCIEAGAAAVMSAYNKVRGEHCGHNRYLLRDILKREWGFQGLVMSDFVLGVRNAKAAALGGLDIEMPLRMYYYWRLAKLVRTGAVPKAMIDESVMRILSQKIRFAQVGEPGRYGRHAVASAAHRALAREAAQKSMVLLKNAPGPDGLPVLPLVPTRLKSLAVIGKLAAIGNIGDHGSSMVRPPAIVTPLAGLRAAAGSRFKVRFNKGRDIASAVRTAQAADAVVIVAGYTHREEGEFIPIPPKGGDRNDLRLNRHDEALIQAVALSNPRTVVVLIGGSAIITETWAELVPAILMAWYPGMEGGHALADILMGMINPSGKLPCVFPRAESQLPFFDKHARRVTYDAWHGYRLMDKAGHEPAFAFGFGLSYTTFAYSGLTLDQSEVTRDGTLTATVTVTNTGARAGEEVVQLYIGYPDSAVERPVKDLKGFARVKLGPGQSRAVEIKLGIQKLAYYDAGAAAWKVEAMGYQVFIGSSSRASDLLQGSFRVID